MLVFWVVALCNFLAMYTGVSKERTAYTVSSETMLPRPRRAQSEQFLAY